MSTAAPAHCFFLYPPSHSTFLITFWNADYNKQRIRTEVPRFYKAVFARFLIQKMQRTPYKKRNFS